MPISVSSPTLPHSQKLGLERIASAHSSRTASSSDAAGSRHASSTGTSAMSGLMTPSYHPDVDDHGPDEDLTDHEMDDMYAEADAARHRLGAMGTRSMQDMKSGKGRERSMTDARPAPPPFVLSPPIPSHLPAAIRRPAHPIAPSKPAKTSGSFSSFLRRLTGKGPKNKDKNIPTPQPPLPTSARQNWSPPKPAPTSRPQVTRQETAPAVISIAPLPRQPAVRQNSVPVRPDLHQLDTRDSLRGPQPLSAPIRPSPRESTFVRETDPLKIPLPPSPTLSPIANPFEDDLLDFSSPLPSSDRPSQRRKQSPMLSFEGFEIEEESEEEADQVRPLRPLRITVDDSHRSLSRDSQGPKSGSSTETSIRTPLSAAGGNYWQGAAGSESESSPENHVSRLAGSSPPRKAPVGTGPMLDRKESKWRKSVMGLSDTVARKQTTRQPPPSSHDAYMIQQRRMANNRFSCAPTLHSNASIGANLTNIKSKEEQDMAETFFLA